MCRVDAFRVCESVISIQKILSELFLFTLDTRFTQEIQYIFLDNRVDQPLLVGFEVSSEHDGQGRLTSCGIHAK